MKRQTKMMLDAGILTTQDKKNLKELIEEQEDLEKEAELELSAAKMSISIKSSTSGDIYDDGDQSPLKG